MEYRRWRVFIDTSALLAGLISTKGAAHQILLAAEVKLIELLLSSDVLFEADRNIDKKFPHLIQAYRAFIHRCEPTLVNDPSKDEIEKAIPLVGRDDAPILAAALASKATYLVTWNTRDFMTAKIPKDLPLMIMTPAEFIRAWSDYFKGWPA